MMSASKIASAVPAHVPTNLPSLPSHLPSIPTLLPSEVTDRAREMTDLAKEMTGRAREAVDVVTGAKQKRRRRMSFGMFSLLLAGTGIGLYVLMRSRRSSSREVDETQSSGVYART
jgi:hypothetical protein